MKITVKLSRDWTGAYRAWCPSLPGCTVWAWTRSQALKRLDKAVHGYLDHISVTLPRELGQLVHDLEKPVGVMNS